MIVSNITVEELKEKAIQLRQTAVTMVYHAQSGHPGGSLSAADFVTALYFREMNVNPEDPEWADRDRFVLSKGHVAPIQYAALAHRGFVPMETVKTLREYKSPFQGHPDSKKMSWNRYLYRLSWAGTILCSRHGISREIR